MRTTRPQIRPVALAAVLVVLLVVAWHATAGDRAAALGRGATLADLLVAGAGLVVVVTLGWLVLLTTLLVLEPSAGCRLTGWAGCPAGVRRALLVVCGAATATALALPAEATTHGPDPLPGPTTGPDHGTSALLDGLPMPDRPLGAAPRWAADQPVPVRRAQPVALEHARVARPVRRTAPAAAAVQEHTVRPGDTLWDVAAARLGPDADASATERAWRLIYAANRDVIGTDPDLILPGTTLRVPPTVQEDRP